MPKQGLNRKRGRPPKFGRPGQVVALTLPQETVRGLRRVDPDIGWAIVSLLEAKAGRGDGARAAPADSELVQVAGRRSLIVVNRDVMKHLPGVNVIPLHGNRGFLALEPGRGMSDLELAVLDRLATHALDAREHRALVQLRTQLRKWRRDRHLQIYTRAIIVIEQANGSSSRASAGAVSRAPRRPPAPDAD